MDFRLSRLLGTVFFRDQSNGFLRPSRCKLSSIISTKSYNRFSREKGTPVSKFRVYNIGRDIAEGLASLGFKGARSRPQQVPGDVGVRCASRRRTQLFRAKPRALQCWDKRLEGRTRLSRTRTTAIPRKPKYP